MTEARRDATHAAGHAENAGNHAESTTGAQCIDAAGGAQRRVTGGRGTQLDIFSRAPLLLSTEHYLGPIGGSVYEDAHGVIVCGHPSSRFLPQSWVELKRWCIGRPGVPNAGSMMWRGARRWIAETFPGASTVVSYSDPSVGHTGALYRACGWLWAPTWHRLRPPPTGGGTWDGETMSAPKDRWVFLLREDADRARVLAMGDESIGRRMPWASYVEPTWRRGVPHGGGGNYARWRREAA